MELIATHVTQRYEISSSLGTISRIQLAYCPHSEISFLGGSNGVVLAISKDGSKVMEWKLSSSVNQIVLCPTGTSSVLARTTDGAVYRLQALVSDDERQTKRARLDVSEDWRKPLFQVPDQCYWIQPSSRDYPAKIYCLLASNEMVIYDFESKSTENYEPEPASTRHENVTVTPVKFTDAPGNVDPFLAEYFELGTTAGTSGLLIGFDDGSICYESIQQDNQIHLVDRMCEPVQSIYPMQLVSTSSMDTIVIIGTCGTVNLHAKVVDGNGKPNIVFKEFMIPTPVVASAAINANTLLVAANGGRIFLVNFCSEGDIQPSLDNVGINIVSLEALEGVKKLQVIAVDDQSHRISFQALERNGSLLTVSFNTSLPLISIIENPEELKKAIQNTLKELAICEVEKKKLDTYRELVQSNLISTTKTIHTVQQMCIQKRKDPNYFLCEVQPMIGIMPSVSHDANTFLRLHIKTLPHFEWYNWQLVVDLACHRSTAQERITFDMKSIDNVNGTTLRYPLSTFGKLTTESDKEYQTCDIDVPLAAEDIRFPLKVNISVELLLDNHSGDRVNSELSTIGGLENNAHKSVLMPVTDTVVDYIDFITPRSTNQEAFGCVQTASIAKNRLYSALGDQPFVKSCPTLTSLYAKENNELLKGLSRKFSKEACIRFKVLNTPDYTLAEAYQEVLSTLLYDLRAEDDIHKIVLNTETARFSFPSHPDQPVTLSLQRNITQDKPSMELDNLSPMDISLFVRCQNAHVLLKAEAAILFRLRYQVSKEDEEELSPYFYKQHQELSRTLSTLEEQLQQPKQTESIGDTLMKAAILIQELRETAMIGTFLFPAPPWTDSSLLA